LGDYLGIKPFEAADYLQSDEDCAQYLHACMDEFPEDAALFTKAVGDIARAHGMIGATNVLADLMLPISQTFPLIIRCKRNNTKFRERRL
jgi:hypothetical protein